MSISVTFRCIRCKRLTTIKWAEHMASSGLPTCPIDSGFMEVYRVNESRARTSVLASALQDSRKDGSSPKTPKPPSPSHDH